MIKQTRLSVTLFYVHCLSRYIFMQTGNWNVCGVAICVSRQVQSVEFCDKGNKLSASPTSAEFVYQVIDYLIPRKHSASCIRLIAVHTMGVNVLLSGIWGHVTVCSFISVSITWKFVLLLLLHFHSLIITINNHHLPSHRATARNPFRHKVRPNQNKFFP
jgi:hypothetical protein